LIRARHAINPAHACHSADVLTPTERAAERDKHGFVPRGTLVYRDTACKWGDVQHIRDMLESIRGKS